MSKPKDKKDTEADRLARINEIADQIYRAIRKKGLTMHEFQMVLYRIRKMAANNSKL